MKQPDEPTLFEDDQNDSPVHDWRREWRGMPEFVQEEQKPFSTIIVRFATKQDLDDFADKIGQKLTPRTKSIWHPQLIRGLDCVERWADES